MRSGRRLRRGLAAVVVAAGALWLPAAAGACTAVGLRFADHPGYVSVTIDFVAGTITANQVEATDPNPFDGTAALRITRPAIHTQISTRSGLGVTVHITQSTGRLQIQIRATRNRFKYLGYAVPQGNRLVIELWKSRPPSRAAEVRRGARGCLTLDRSTVATGLVTASGRSRGLFENQAVLSVRGADGRVLAQQTVHVRGGRWSGRLSYRASRSQPATLEVHDASAKDGSLVCLVQIRVTLPASPPPVAVMVLARYPQQCLRPVTRTTGAGLVAAINTGVTVAAPTGQNAVTGHYTPPPMGSYMPGVRYLQWSPDGRWLALRWGNLITTSGASAGDLFPTPALGAWTWSPASDCVLAITQSSRTQTTLSVGAPGRRGRAFLRGQFGAFAFSPNGRRLYIVTSRPLDRPRFVSLDLVSGRLQDIGAAPGSGCCLSFGGWAPGGRILLFWAGEGASVMADGVTVEGLDTAHSNRIVTYGTRTAPATTLPAPDSLATCGGSLLAVVGIGRTNTTVSDKRLAFIAPGRPPSYLTPKTAAYLSPSCAPDGTAAAAVRYANGARIGAPAPVTIVSVKTGAERALTPTGSFTDAAPDWGAPGLLYARATSPSTPFQLWYAPLAAGAGDTGLRAVNTAGTWDWSATPPSGIGG